MLDSLKCFVAEKRALSSLNQSVIQGIIFKVCYRSKSRLLHSIVGFQKLASDKKIITILLNLRFISFIANKSLFFIMQY